MTCFYDGVDIHELLAECSKLALLAGQVIREVHMARVESGNNVLDGHLKEEGDLKSVATVADIRAQRVIVTALRLKFPGLSIVGEEEEDESIPTESCNDLEPVEQHPFLASHCLQDLGKGKVLKLDSIVVYIDPLDGTHEFVEGRVHHVQTLIGVAVNGTPCAGIVGLPFWGQNVSHSVDGIVSLDVTKGGEGGAVIAGVVGKGVVGFTVHAPPSPHTLHLASSSSIKHPALIDVQTVLISPPYNATPVVVPACGNKIFSLLRGECDIAVFNLKTSLWDTCATQAMLVASGGTVTDLAGCPINHSHPSIARNNTTGNVFGVLASTHTVNHADIVKHFRQLSSVTKLMEHAGLIGHPSGTASDICRDTYGQPLTTALLSNVTGGEVVSYQCPEDQAQRYLMSAAGRICITYKNNTTELPQSLFLKRAVMRELPHAVAKLADAPDKLKRDVKSYLVEASFLACTACGTLAHSTDVCVARCKKAEIFPNESPIDSRFSLLLEDFSPSSDWSQVSMLNMQQLTAGIKALAKFHAFFWNGGVYNKYLSDGDVSEVAACVWDVATHWAPIRQPADMMQQIANRWDKHSYAEVHMFGDGSTACRSIGERLQVVAPAVGLACHLHPSSSHPHRTIIHGDAKAGNLFFKPQAEDGMGLIDFQWCGFGLGSTDLAYFIAASAGPNTVSADGTEELLLLRTYHDVLNTELARLGNVDSVNMVVPSLEELGNQYDAAMLDVCRIAFAYHWERLPASPAVFTSERGGLLGPCAYNKDTQVARWLVATCDRLLTKRETAQK